MRGLAVDSRLEAVAGVPAGALWSSGSVPLTGFGALGDRTLIAVWDQSAAFSSYLNIARMSQSPAVAPELVVFGLTGGTTVRVQSQAIGAANAPTDFALTSGRYAAAIVMRNGMTVSDRYVLGLPSQTVTVAAGSGMTDGPLLELRSDATTIGRAALAYREALTAWQCTEVMRRALMRVPTT